LPKIIGVGVAHVAELKQNDPASTNDFRTAKKVLKHLLKCLKNLKMQRELFDLCRKILEL
jgi:hypothetical protein